VLAAITSGARTSKAAPDLTRDQLAELWLGAGRHGSHFGSREELRAAWNAGRDRAMALWVTAAAPA